MREIRVKATSDTPLCIYKYHLAAASEQGIYLPRGAQILAVDIQDNSPVFWAIVDPSVPTECRRLLVFGTGQPVYSLDRAMELRYIGTWQHGGYVWHLFEEVKASTSDG
jgi:hypothetical protein